MSLKGKISRPNCYPPCKAREAPNIYKKILLYRHFYEKSRKMCNFASLFKKLQCVTAIADFGRFQTIKKMHIKFLFFLDFQFRRWRHYCILFIQCTLGLSLEELGHYFVVPFLWDTVYRRARERRTKHTTTNLPFLFTKSSRYFSMKI